ncbi:MAG: phage Gp37/Gp68 family protein [Syntrophorhabdaceae bacterium]
MQKTKISFLTHTWNPIAMRCDPASPGCANCWHLRTADRLKNNPGLPVDERKALAGEGPFVLRDRELSEPLKLKKPAVIGVQFMGDLFHPDVDFDFQNKVFVNIALATQHVFLVLTKRPENLLSFIKGWRGQLDNVYLGVTVVNQSEADERIPLLLEVPGKRFLSIEPMLGPIDLSKDYLTDKCDKVFPFPGRKDKHRTKYIDLIDWVACGGETGPRARPLHPDWVRSIRDQCILTNTPFYFKQWGEWYFKNNTPKTSERHHSGMFRVGSKRAGRILDGREWNEVPWDKG